MDTIPIYVAPAWVENTQTVQVYADALLLVNQLHPLPPVIGLRLTPFQWDAIEGGARPDVGRMVFPFVGGEEAVVLWDETVPLAPGLSWELASLAQGWWFDDDPATVHPAQIGPGPQYGQTLAAPNYLLADLLFIEGGWEWLFWLNG